MQSQAPQKPRLALLLLACGLFLIVWGARLSVIDRFGTDLPVWDEWLGFAYRVVLPYEQGTLSPLDLLQPHNEHRIVCTKLLSLGLLLANGQWDVRLGCTVDAALYATLAVGAFWFGVRCLRPIWQLAWFVSLAVLAAYPIAWLNLLSAFHSQQYFLVAFSLATIASFISAPYAGSRLWFLGVFCGFASLGTQASGLLAAAATTAIIGPDIRSWTMLRRYAPTLIVCALLIAVGLYTQVTVPEHIQYRAHSIAEFSRTFWRNLQWPVQEFVAFPILIWLPWTVTSLRILRRKADVSAFERILAATGFWTLLQFAAVSYGRGAGGVWPSNRYLDTNLVGIFTNLLCYFAAISRLASAKHRWHYFIAVPTVLLLVAALSRDLRETFSLSLPEYKAVNGRREANTWAYLTTGNESFLDGPDIPFPGKVTFLEFLRHPEIRSILPACIREPAHLTGKAAPLRSIEYTAVAPETPRPLRESTWGSYATSGAATMGKWQSELLAPAKRSYWQFWTTSNLKTSDPSLAIELVSDNGTLLQKISSSNATADGWSKVIVPAPTVPCRIVITDETSQAWVGTSAPTEMAKGSWLTLRLVHYGNVFWKCGIGISLFAFLVGFRKGRQRNHPGEAPAIIPSIAS